MMIELKDWNDNPYMGTVQSVSLEAKYENGVTYYPCTVTMDNPDGAIMSGQGMRYSFVASESTDVMVVHVASVNYVSDPNTGETATVCFVKADEKPENALELSEEAMSNVPEGYYPVPVEVGLADNFNVEIKSGLSEGDTVFEAYITDQGNSYSGGGMVFYG